MMRTLSRAVVRAPLGIALLAGPLTWLIQSVLRPAMRRHSIVLWALGPAPNVVVALCFPFAALSYPYESLAGARRAVAITTVLTVVILVIFEVWRPLAGARTFDPLDIVGSVVGGLVGGRLALALARRRINNTDGGSNSVDVRAMARRQFNER